MPKKASIIINSYQNRSGFLTRAIRSCLDQKGVEIELILSTVKGDSSIETARSISRKIIIVENEKPGIYQQLNNALSHITSDWFAYFSGNDVALPRKIHDEIGCCRKGKKVCYSDYFITDGKLNKKQRIRLLDYNHRTHLRRNFITDVSLVHKSLLDKYGPFRLKYGNHAYWDFWLRIAEGEGRSIFAYNSKPEWLYRVSGESRHVAREKDREKKRRNERLKRILLADHRNKRVK